MLGRAPSTIIIDNDKAMGKAIAEVLPNTTHRLCLGHILQKVPKHFAHIYNKYPSFQVDFHHCIHDTLTIEEFELELSLFVSKYELRENDWLNKLYMRREKWVPAYLRNSFYASMSKTQRSESMNNELRENDWLNKLYMRREKWVPAYLRNSFYAGMSTTQQSESMNKFFKDYVRSSTMVCDFVHQYEKALNARYLKERKRCQDKNF
jgi:ribosomal protein L11 methylase PrmA